VSVLIYPAQVQGEDAAAEVSAGIRYFSRERNVDVVIVARGGGSIEDLAAFNHEGLARTVAASKVPVISAVGHETDVTIIDFVADLRAPTPSAAAEIVIRSRHELEEHVANLRTRLARAARYQMLRGRQALTELAQHGAFARMAELINRRQQRVDELVFRLAHAERDYLGHYRQRLDVAAARIRYHDLRRQLAGTRRVLDGQVSALSSVTRAVLAGRRADVDRLTGRLQDLSPLNILERGYALVFNAEGKLVKDSAQVEADNPLHIRLARGALDARVEKTSPAEGRGKRP
jgi:exodeoxyribonuclease VII large subunit